MGQRTGADKTENLMRAFTTLDAVAAPIEGRNVNTDQILPTRFLKKPRGPEYASYMFHDHRFTPDGAERPEFVLNQEPYRAALILVGDSNLGCGSSRETAVYTLDDYGIRAVIAPSFGDIFAANCVKNGLLPIGLADAAAASVRAQLVASPGARLVVDLNAQTVTDAEGRAHRFDIGAFEKECLIAGLDDVDITLRHEAEISAFEESYREGFDWLFASPGAAGPR